MNSLLIHKGIYAQDEFQQLFIEWVKKEQSKKAVPATSPAPRPLSLRKDFVPAGMLAERTFSSRDCRYHTVRTRNYKLAALSSGGLDFPTSKPK